MQCIIYSYVALGTHRLKLTLSHFNCTAVLMQNPFDVRFSSTIRPQASAPSQHTVIFLTWQTPSLRHTPWLKSLKLGCCCQSRGQRCTFFVDVAVWTHVGKTLKHVLPFAQRRGQPQGFTFSLRRQWTTSCLDQGSNMPLTRIKMQITNELHGISLRFAIGSENMP